MWYVGCLCQTETEGLRVVMRHQVMAIRRIYVSIACRGNGPYKVLITHPNCAGGKINDCSYGQPGAAQIVQNVALVRDELLVHRAVTFEYVYV